MTTYNTGNPIGSTAVKDLYDNAENLDTAVNDMARPTWVDRLGRSRKTMSGMEAEFDADQLYRENEFIASQADKQNRFNNFIASSGYQFLGDYAAGIEITEYNQIVRDADGEFWRLSGQVELPYTTTGAGLPEGDALTPLGDAVLRQELAMPGGAELVGNAAMYFSSTTELLSHPTIELKNGQVAIVRGCKFTFDSITDTWVPSEGVSIEAITGKSNPTSADFNSALLSGYRVLLMTSPSYELSEPVFIPEGVTLMSAKGKVEINYHGVNSSCITVGKDAWFEGAVINMLSTHTSGTASGIRLSLSLPASRPIVRNVEIKGTESAGWTAHGIYVGGEDGQISYGTISNIYCERVNTALFVDIEDYTGYCNGCIIDNFIIRSSVRAIDANRFDANQINGLAWNTGSVSSYPIRLNGSSFNFISGYFYDLNQSPSSPNVLAHYEGDASSNLVITQSPSASIKVVDSTLLKLNFLNINKRDLFQGVGEICAIPATYSLTNEMNEEGFAYRNKPYGGHQDNIWAFADKIQGVESTGAPISAGTLANLFNPFARYSTGKPQWNLAQGEEAILEINLTAPTSEPTKRIDFVQICFTNGLKASNISLEALVGETWVVVGSVTDNTKQYVTFHGNRTGVIGGVAMNNATKIRVKFSGQLSSLIRLESLVARVITSPGYTFLGRDGGIVFGNIEFDNSASGPVIKSPNGNRFKIAVDDTGVLSAVPL